MGSVKDLKVIVPPDKDKPGVGRFSFSDRYSVFDWGEMPQHIEGKGKALCIIGAYFFKRMKEKNIKNHFRGVVENGKVKSLSELKEASGTMEVELVRVVKPPFKNGKYDYSVYKKEKNNFLVPLEIIYRNELPASSSLFARFKSGEMKAEDFGLKEIPPAGTVFEKPLLDVSTKLESKDRYLRWEEASEISNLNVERIDEIKSLVLKVNKIITDDAAKMNLQNIDGKLEFAVDRTGSLTVVDVAGTPDESRFVYQDKREVPVSKEILRKYYRGTGWYKEVKEASEKGVKNWKELVGSGPPDIPDGLLESVSWLYKSFCNQLTGRGWFDVPDFEEVIERLESYGRPEI